MWLFGIQQAKLKGVGSVHYEVDRGSIDTENLRRFTRRWTRALDVCIIGVEIELSGLTRCQ